MTLVVAHFMEDKPAVVTDGAGNSGPKCGLLPRHSAIVARWGDYDLPPTFLCFPPGTVRAEVQDLARANYIGDALPDPKNCRDNFVAAFQSELNGSPNVHNGGRGPAGLLLAFAHDCAIEAIVCDANSGRGGWKPRPGSLTWPAFFGQDHEVRNMLKSIGVKPPTEFIGAVTSVEDFAGRIKELIVRKSDLLDANGLVTSIGLPAWLLVLSKEGSATTPKQAA